MDVLAFTVINKKVECDIKQVVGDNDYQASFLLDEEWDDKEVICRVIWNKKTSLDITLEDFSCVIPAYMMKTGEVFIGVYVKGDENLSSTQHKIGVLQSIKEDTYKTSVPNKEIWDEINEKVADVVTNSEFDAKVNAYLGEELISYSESPNLLGLTDIAETTSNGITYSVIDNVISLSGTATDTTDISFLNNMASDLLSAGTYNARFFNVENSLSGNVKLGYTSSAFVDVTSSGGTITLSEDMVRCKIRIGSGVTVNCKIAIMITANDVKITNYVPYGQKTKTVKEDISIPTLAKHLAETDIHITAKEKEYLSNVASSDNTFDDEIVKTSSDVLQCINGKSLVFCLMSDSHVYPDYDENDSSVKHYKSEIEHIAKLNENIPFDAMVHLGDFVNTQWLWKNHTTTDIEYQRMVAECANMLKSTNIKDIYICAGNHDSGFIPNETDIGEEYSGFGNYYRNFGKLSDNSGKTVRYDNDLSGYESPYYYVDYDSLKLRCIFLCTNQHSTTSDYKGYCYSQELWLKQTLDNIPTDYNVLMFGHIPMSLWHTKMTNASNMVALANAFNAHTSVDLDGSSLDSDFSEKQGKILAYISGHYHADKVVLPTDEKAYYNFPEISIGSGSFLMNKVIVTGDYYDEADCPSRELGTVTEDLFDVMIYSPTDNKLYFKRFGAGDDREIDLSILN